MIAPGPELCWHPGCELFTGQKDAHRPQACEDCPGGELTPKTGAYRGGHMLEAKQALTRWSADGINEGEQ